MNSKVNPSNIHNKTWMESLADAIPCWSDNGVPPLHKGAFSHFEEVNPNIPLPPFPPHTKPAQQIQQPTGVAFAIVACVAGNQIFETSKNYFYLCGGPIGNEIKIGWTPIDNGMIMKFRDLDSAISFISTSAFTDLLKKDLNRELCIDVIKRNYEVVKSFKAKTVLEVTEVEVQKATS